MLARTAALGVPIFASTGRSDDDYQPLSERGSELTTLATFGGRTYPFTPRSLHVASKPREQAAGSVSCLDKDVGADQRHDTLEQVRLRARGKIPWVS